MSYSIFISNPTALIAQPGRAVNTFPSGLVRVDQTYLGLTSQTSTHRATLAIGNNMPDGNSSPCIDGLKIFPEVQERRREDGFTEFIVSAYGRSNLQGNKTFSKELGEFTTRYTAWHSRPPIIYSPAIVNDAIHQSINDQLIWKFVTPKGAVPNVTTADNLRVYQLTGAADFLLNQIFNRSAYNAEHESIVPIDSLLIGQNKKITSAENINFGNFDEWTVVWSAIPNELLDFGTYSRVFAPESEDVVHDIDLLPSQAAFWNVKNLTAINNLNDGNSYETLISKVENIHAVQAWSSAAPRTNILTGVATPTWRGGSLVWNGTNLNYTLPTVGRPSGSPYNYETGHIYESNGFSWVVAEIVTPPVEEDGFVFVQKFWQFQTSYEFFLVTLINERGMTSQHSVTLKFIDTQYPAVEVV